MSNNNNNDNIRPNINQEDVAVLDQLKTKLPSRYHVILLNDDYTTMEFVVWVIQKVFFKNEEEAKEIMLKIHYEGKGICGTYNFETAESKRNQVHQHATEQGHPLKCILEQTDS